MDKHLININRSNNSTVKGSGKSSSRADGNFSRRPPHTPPKSTGSPTKSGKIK